MRKNPGNIAGRRLAIMLLTNYLICTSPLFISTAKADFSWREHRMNLVEAALEKNRQQFRALGFRQERHLAALASDPGKSNPAIVVARFSARALARTIKFNQDMAAIDRELDDDYKQWRARTGRGSKLEWRETPRATDLMAYALRARITLRVAYTADIKKLEQEVLRGQDDILKQMNREREILLQEHKDLLDELEFLKTHREDEVRERPSLADRHAGFKFELVGATERYLNLGDTGNIEFSITPGSISTTLRVIANDALNETIALAPTSRYRWSSQFNSPGIKSRLFILEDNSIPRRSSTINVIFHVRDVSSTSTPSLKPVSDTQGPVITIESHNKSQPWSRVSQGATVLAGKVTDLGRGNSGVHAVYINNSLVDLGGTTTGDRTVSWRETLTLSSGWNKITVQAYDHSPAYNKTEEVLWVYYNSPDEQRNNSDTVQPPDPPPVLTAELDCGDSFELAPGDFVGRGCYLAVRGWHNTDEMVVVNVDYDERSGIEVFPKNDSQHPMHMSDPGFSVSPDRYIFSLSFRAQKNAPPGITPVMITVGQSGAGRIVLPLWISVLGEGILPGLGSGIRPPAEVVTGSGGEYCVWRYKSFGDRPECFNFVRAACNNPRYAAPRYELVGSAMTWRESGLRMAQLGSYHEDAYGCHAWQDAEGESPVVDVPGDPESPSGGSEDPTDDWVKLPDLTGKLLGEAKKWIQDNNLKAVFLPGTPAPTADKTGTVENQHPAKGTSVKHESTVMLTVHSPYVDTRKVPDVTGLPAGEARQRMQAESLNPVLQPGSEPPSVDHAGRIEQQNPAPGTTAPIGSTVNLIVFGPYVEKTVVPDIQGLAQDNARSRLEAAGLVMDRREAGRPLESRLGLTVQKQEPAAGNSLAKGSTVVVWVYDQYTPSREEQVAVADCSQYAGSRAYWDDTAGRPLCGCFDGLVWNLARIHCVTAEVYANEICARDLPGTIARGRTADGKINCVCPDGQFWNASPRKCERQLTDQELCSRDYPGSVATGKDASGRVNCDCPQGHVWANNPRRCIKSDPRCEQYARTAVEQYRQNLANRCGYTGARWSDNYQGHYGWCLKASQAFAEAETQARIDGLNKCTSSTLPVQRSCTFDTSMMAGDEIWCDAYMECHDAECKVTTMHVVNISHIKRGFKAPEKWLYSGYNSCEGTLRHYRVAAGCR